MGRGGGLAGPALLQQLSSVLQAGVIVVTPRGWYSDDDELWGIHPRAVWNSAGAA